jgi:hypothetical protein
MLIVSLLFAIGTAFIPMPRVFHLLVTMLIVAAAFFVMGIGGCTKYWDDHMQPGRTVGGEMIFSAIAVLVARLLAMLFFRRATDVEEPTNSRRKRYERPR